MRKNTLFKLKERHKIAITAIPKVLIKVSFRRDGSWTYSWGYKSYDYLVSKGQYYDEDGKYIYTGKRSGMSGQDYTIKSLWRHVKKEAYRNNIHQMDLAILSP